MAAGLLLLAPVPTALRAQDAHYWTLQNGARATLLGGTGAALEPELSASFYNPGSLAHLTDGDALSMFVKTTARVRVDFGTAPEVVGESEIGSSAPGFFAFRLPIHLVDGDVMTFSYLVRQTSELDLSGLGITSPTIPTSAIDIFVFQDVSDGWYGLSWAKGVTDEVGVGVSVFYSSISYRQRVQSRTASVTGVIDGYLESDALDVVFSPRRLVAKAGATWELGPVAFGGTLTLPSVRLPLSGGHVTVSHAFLSDEDGTTVELAQNRQEDLSANYRNPFSAALGARAHVAGVDVYTSAEWFASMDPYDVLDTKPFTAQEPAVELELPIRQQRESVLNMGTGVAWQASSFLSLFGSVRTDNSFRPESGSSFIGLDPFDLVHWTGGVGVSGGSFDVWLGAMYGHGDARALQTPSPLPGSPVVEAHTRFEQLGFVLAFNASF